MWLFLIVACACIVKEKETFGYKLFKMSPPVCKFVDHGYKLCFTKNQTGNQLRVDCQLIYKPMGTAVNIAFKYEDRLGDVRTIDKSCVFSENMFGNYSCSLTTDVTGYQEGTKLLCSANYVVETKIQQQNIQVLEVMAATSALPGPVSETEVRAAEPFLNCSESGYPRLAWFRDVNETPKDAMIENITRYDPGIFEASCILGCHNHIKSGEEWVLTWALNGTVLQTQRVIDGGLVILKLTANFTEDDNGNELKCSLLSEPQYSTKNINIVEKITTILTDVSQGDVENHRPDELLQTSGEDDQPNDSSISIWSGSIAGSLCLLTVVTTVFFWRRRRENSNVQSKDMGETEKKASLGVVYADLALPSPNVEFNRTQDNTEYAEIVGIIVK